jgi:2-polyprenyl-3-methyl-5-hydroxy-6-metoxy-1,4-benzoquinol methylase
VKSFEYIAKKLKAEHFDPVSAERSVVIPLKHRLSFFHSGDFGDIIYALPTIKAMGGGSLFIGPSVQHKTRLSMTAEHVEVMRPLLEMQPYIHELSFVEKAPEIDIDLNQFREYLLTEHTKMAEGARRLNLAEAHLYTFKVPLDACQSAWLTIDTPTELNDYPVLIHRSPRWRNSDFPWAKIMERHGKRAAFVGLPSEYNAFVADWGYLTYLPTKDFLELARLIAGCRLYIGNQSLPYAICEGLKHDSMLEVWLEGPNCIFNRRNAIYGESAIVHIPKLYKKSMNTVLTKCPICDADAANAPQHRAQTDIVKCPSCNLVYLRTHPDHEQTMLYYQQYADDHSHMRLPKNFDDIRTSGLRRDYFMQQLMEFAKPPGKMLDIGCGWGAFMVNAREKGFTPQGIDVCYKAANFSNSVLGIPTTCDELLDCAIDADSLDVIVAIHTFEHLSKPAEVLSRVCKLLKVGGIFAGIVPNIESYCSEQRKEKWQWLDVNTHYVHYSPATLKATLEKFGFDVLRVYTHTGDYDLNELRRLIQERENRVMKTEEIDAEIEKVWASGNGEEIRFFAVKRSTVVA